MKKKLLFIVFTLLLCFSLTACKKKNEVDSSSKEHSEPITMDDESSDKSKDEDSDEDSKETSSGTSTPTESIGNKKTAEDDGFPEIEEDNGTISNSVPGQTSGSTSNSSESSNDSNEEEKDEETDEEPSYSLPLEPEQGYFSPGIL